MHGAWDPRGVLRQRRRHAEVQEVHSIRENGQVALVGEQRVITGIWCDHDGARAIGVLEGSVLRLVEREINQPVVNQIDRRIAGPQLALAVAARRRGQRATAV